MSQRRFKIILNPYAGRWKARNNLEILKLELTQLGLDFDVVTTKAPGEGIDVARQAAEDGYDMVVAAGGDSTINEVVNGLVQAAGDEQAGVLGIIPLGTANDLAHVLNIPQNLKEACQRIATGKIEIIDVCQVNGRYFGNNSAIGLEPMVTLEAEQMSGLKGSLRYITAAFQAIWKRPQWHARLEWDDKATYEGPITLISVGNSNRTGGVFKMTPDAKVNDGKLHFVYAPSMSRLALLRLFPTTFTGKHIHNKSVVYLQASTLKIKIDPTPLHTDGEIIDPAATEVEYSILPQKLRVNV